MCTVVLHVGVRPLGSRRQSVAEALGIDPVDLVVVPDDGHHAPVLPPATGQALDALAQEYGATYVVGALTPECREQAATPVFCADFEPLSARNGAIPRLKFTGVSPR